MRLRSQVLVRVLSLITFVQCARYTHVPRARFALIATGAITEHNIEIGVVSTKDRQFRVLSPAEVRDYLNEVE